MQQSDAFELDAYLLSRTAALRFAVLAAASSAAELAAVAPGELPGGAGPDNDLAQLPLLTPSVLLREEARIAEAQLVACAQLGETAVDLPLFVSVAERGVFYLPLHFKRIMLTILTCPLIY